MLSDDKFYRMFALLARTYAIEYINHLLLLEMRAKSENITFNEMRELYERQIHENAEKYLRIIHGESRGDSGLSETTVDDLLK
jgi:hypothetical protein